jgi:xanthine dehydrogenase accessory factor
MAGRPVALVIPLGGEPAQAWEPGAPLAEDLREAALRAIASDEAQTVQRPGGAIFVQAVSPPLKLIVVGAVHIAEPLVQMARMLGYRVTLIDPREAFARAERWPEVTVKTDWPDEAMGAMTVDARSAIVVLTHDPKIDDPALCSALRSPAFYVGALGSKKTHAARLRRLEKEGFSPEETARVRGPIGLSIGARSPGEIAVSIAAEMTAALRLGGAPRP